MRFGHKNGVVRRKRGWATWGLACLGLLVGTYLLVLALSPTLGGNSQAVTKRLEANPAVNGDRLYIPRIGVDVAIVTGPDESALERGAWHRHPEQGDPEKGNNFVLSAHRFVMGWTPQQTVTRSPFYNINKLEPGDSLLVDFKNKRYAYTITKKYRVNPDQINIENPSSTPKLTLYSCTFGGSADGRDVIEAIPLDF